MLADLRCTPWLHQIERGWPGWWAKCEHAAYLKNGLGGCRGPSLCHVRPVLCPCGGARGPVSGKGAPLSCNRGLTPDGPGARVWLVYCLKRVRSWPFAKICPEGGRAGRQVRESLYQGVGIMATQAAGFFAAGAEARGLWAPALTGGLEAMPAQHARLLIRHIVSPLCRACPPAHRAAWLVPVLNRLMPHMLERLGAGWRVLDAAGPGFEQGLGFERGLGAGAGLANGAHAAAAEDEVVAERLLRELTQEHMLMLKVLQQPASGGSQVCLPCRCHLDGAQAVLTQEHMIMLMVLQQPAAGGSQVRQAVGVARLPAQVELMQEHMS